MGAVLRLVRGFGAAAQFPGPVDVASAPPAGDGRQIVRAGHRDGLAVPPLRRSETALPVALEPQYAHAEHFTRLQLRAQPLGYGAEILADHDRPHAMGFDRENSEHVLQRIAQIGAFSGRCAMRHHPQAVQPQRMVDANAAGMIERGSQGANEAFEAGTFERRGREAGKAPVLPIRAQRIRRGTDRKTGKQVFRPAPGVASTAVHPDREI